MRMQIWVCGVYIDLYAILCTQIYIYLWNAPLQYLDTVCILLACLWQKLPLEENKHRMLYLHVLTGKYVSDYGHNFSLPVKGAIRHESMSLLANRVGPDGERDNSQASYGSSRGKYP